MHKGVILLVKPDGDTEAEKRADAIELAETFLEPYGDGDVWDWLEIGGRWTGELTGCDPTADPRNLEPCDLCQGTGDRKDLEPPEWKKDCGGCNGCGGKGKRVKHNLVEVTDNAMPLTDKRVLAKVQEWAKDWEAKRLAECAEQEAHWKDDKQMSGWLMQKRGKIIADEFCFESNVFDTVKETNALPKSFKGYWAVMVDMHN